MVLEATTDKAPPAGLVRDLKKGARPFREIRRAHAPEAIAKHLQKNLIHIYEAHVGTTRFAMVAMTPLGRMAYGLTRYRTGYERPERPPVDRLPPGPGEIRPHTRFTNAEIAAIEILAGRLTAKQIAMFLPGRSAESVQYTAMKYRIPLAHKDHKKDLPSWAWDDLI